MSRRIPLRALGAWLLALAVIVSFTLPASASPASEVGGSLTIDSLVAGVDSLASVDGPGHHFGYSQASVLAQATAITIQKTGSPSTVAAGGTVTYTIPITNVSGTAATGVTVTDTLPAGTTLASVPTTSTGTCTGAAGTASFTCSLGTLGAGSAATISAVVVVPTTATNGSVFTNTATVTGTVGNSTQSATATAATTVTSTTPTNGSPTAATALPVLQAGGFSSAGFNNGFQNNTCGGLGQQGLGQQFFQGQNFFPGGTCQVTGAVTGTATITGSAVWNLTVAAAPAGALAGVAPVAFALTTVAPVAPGEGPFPCTALAVVGGTTTCNFTTTGNPLAGLTAAVCFATAGAPVCVFGTVTGNGANVLPIIPQNIGPGFGPQLPLLPPPPLQFIPPPPPPLLPPPPPAPTGAAMVRPAFPDVPVVPEADTVVLLFGGLAALGIAAGARSLRRRKR